MLSSFYYVIFVNTPNSKSMNYQYGALAASVRLKDITSSAENRAFLHRIKNNDPALTSLFIDYSYEEDDENVDIYQVREGDYLGWLGYFIGEKKTLEFLYLCNLPKCTDRVKSFFDAMQPNKSMEMQFVGDDLPSCSFSAINLPHVTSMSIKCDLDREKAHHLAFGLQRCKSLKSYHGPITAEIAESLTNLPMFENIRLYLNEGQAISLDECLAFGKLLAKATKMKQLDISYAGLVNDGLEFLAEGLACNSSLTGGVLNLSNNEIGDEGLQALASSLLASNTKLQKLFLANNNIGDAGLEALADSLAHNRALRFLSVEGNTAITERGVKAISRVLQSRRSRLKDLYLDRININDEGGGILAKTLSINKSLVKLSLRSYENGVSISDDGLRALSTGLSRNTTLRSLHLSGNTAITAVGFRALKQYFSSPSCALENLYLNRINIGDEGAHALADALGRNKSLKRLLFFKFGIAFKGWEAFLKLLCDTSSPHSIYLSNHTLCNLGPWWYLSTSRTRSDVHDSVIRWLNTNTTYETPNLAAKAKILHVFPDLDMVPLFRWNLKTLPLIKSWFDTFTSSNDELKASIRSRKLSAVYQFVRGLPVLVVFNFRRYLADQVQRMEEEERVAHYFIERATLSIERRDSSP